MIVKTSKTGRVTLEDDKKFALEFLEDSAKKRSADDDLDEEVYENYFVQPAGDIETTGPYHYPPAWQDETRLKDTETTQLVETLTAKLLLSTIGETGFAQAQPVGPENAAGADVVSALTEANFEAPGNFRAMYVAYKNATLLGATAVFPTWDYQEGDRTFRRVSVDPMTFQERVDTQVENAVLRDGIRLIPVDRDDLFIDYGHDTMERMQACGRRFIIPRWEAEEMAEQLDPDGKPRWDPEAVRRAVESGSADPVRVSDSWREGTDKDQRQQGSADAYENLIGYEVYAMTPHLNPDKKRRRRITLLQGEIVESRPMPLHVSRTVPFYDFVMNPVQGRWRGLAPGHIARYMQSFYDALLISLADSIVRMAKPPIAVRRGAAVNRDMVMAWRGIIPLDNMDDIREIQYNPHLAEAFNMLSMMKQTMREGTGASGAVQGFGFGTKRMSGTESAFLAKQVLDRPEMYAAMYEREYLPALSLGMFELSQQFIRSSDDLQRRVGSAVLKNAPLLDDIQGQYNIRFVGSRRMNTKQDRLQAIQSLIQIVGAIPGAAAIFPWQEALVEWVAAADLSKLENMIANPQRTMDTIARTMLMSRAGQGPGAASANGNGAMPATMPMGMLPAQIAGR